MNERDKLEAEFRARRVAVYRDVQETRLHSFQIDYTKLEGSFRAAFDGRECPDEFQFRFNPEGRHVVCLPMTDYAHTELIVTVEMPVAAKQALQRAIEELFPGIKPYGESPKIDFQTPIKQRVPSANYLEMLRRTVGRRGFEHRVRIPGTK
jgi:hypothetical protein